MSRLSAEVLTILQRQVGLITSRQLSEGGISRDTRQLMVEQGVFERPYKSVYMVATRCPTFEQRLVALSLAHPAGFITGPTLGGYLGLRRMPRASKIHLCLPHPIRIDKPRGVLLRQSTRIGPLDTRVLGNGMRVASWPRLMFDLAADLTKLNLTSVIDQAVRDGHCTDEELGAIAMRLCHPNRRGSERFTESLMRRGGRTPVESHAELLILEGLHARGVPVEPQHGDLKLSTGRNVRVDLAVPAVRWGVEVDVHPSHMKRPGVVSDKRRDRQLHLADWQIDRVSDDDFAELEPLLDELAALYRARVASLAS